MSIVDDRRATHGDPVHNVKMIAAAWSRVLGVPVTPQKVCDCMVKLHQVRHRWAPVADAAHLEHANGYREIKELLDAEQH